MPFQFQLVLAPILTISLVSGLFVLSDIVTEKIKQHQRPIATEQIPKRRKPTKRHDSIY